MLRLEEIHKSFGDLHVLRGISIEVSKGEVISIVGKSGAGKSTLLHIAGTLDHADSGRILFDGKEVNRMSARSLAHFRNRNIGFIFQFHYLLPEFSALENVAIPAMIGGTSLQTARQKGRRLLDFMGLSERVDHKPDELSGGEQQRVAVARALVNDPMIIFADEPSGNLDSQTSEEMHSLILRLREEMDQTFVIVTHNPELANLSDRTLVMADGRIENEIRNGR